MAGRDLSAVTSIVSAAAPLDAEVAGTAAERRGAPITQAYGMTELSPGTHRVPIPPEAAAPAGTVGELVPSPEPGLVDTATGRDVGPARRARSGSAGRSG